MDTNHAKLLSQIIQENLAIGVLAFVIVVLLALIWQSRADNQKAWSIVDKQSTVLTQIQAILPFLAKQ